MSCHLHDFVNALRSTGVGSVKRNTDEEQA